MLGITQIWFTPECIFKEEENRSCLKNRMPSFKFPFKRLDAEGKPIGWNSEHLKLFLRQFLVIFNRLERLNFI